MYRRWIRIDRPLLLRVRLLQRTRLRQRRIDRHRFAHAGDGGGQATAAHPARIVVGGPCVDELEFFRFRAVACARGEGEGDGVAWSGFLGGAEEARAGADGPWCARGLGDRVEEVVKGADGVGVQAGFLRAGVYDDRVGAVCGADVGGFVGIARLPFLKHPFRRPDQRADGALLALESVPSHGRESAWTIIRSGRVRGEVAVVVADSVVVFDKLLVSGLVAAEPEDVAWLTHF